MGRVRAHTSPSPSRIGMRWSLVLVCVLLLVGISEGKEETSKGKKPGIQEARKPGKRGECDVGSPKLTKKNTRKYTDIGKCTCWWDITRHDCACCKKGVKGGTMQCGYPMHKFCWKKSDRGCPGVCNYKYTLSGKGYPCFSDHSNTDCAWCNKLGYQCEQNSDTGPDAKKGSRCQARTNKKYCASQQGDCKHIAKCDPNATCKKKAKVGKFGQYWQCQCNKAKGWSGNGIQCMDRNGTLSAKPNQRVEVTATLTAGLYEDTPVENEFNHGAAMESLLSEMESAGSSCSGDACEASYEVTEA